MVIKYNLGTTDQIAIFLQHFAANVCVFKD